MAEINPIQKEIHKRAEDAAAQTLTNIYGSLNGFNGFKFTVEGKSFYLTDIFLGILNNKNFELENNFKEAKESLVLMYEQKILDSFIKKYENDHLKTIK